MSHAGLPSVTDGFEHYMARITAFPLLKAEEEFDLANRFHRQGDLAAAHKLTTSNLRFVVKVANEYRGYGYRLADLVQEGNIGLMLAVRKFDPLRGTRLITYAVWWIRAYIQNYIIKSWSLIKIGTTQAQKKLFFKLKQTREALRRLTGQEETEEIARQLDVTVAEVESMSQRLGRRDASLDVELSPGEDYTLMDSLADKRENQEQLLGRKQEQAERRKQIDFALTQLKPRERQIIRQRTMSDQPRTLQELADEFNISRERVRQLETKSLSRLKEVLCQTPLSTGS